MANHAFRGLNMNDSETLEEAYKNYNMDFEAKFVPLQCDLTKFGKPGLVISPYHRQVIHSKTLELLWVVGSGYTIVDHPVAFSLAEPLLKNGTKIVGGGCPNKGERAYLILEAEGKIEIAKNNHIVNRFILVNSHDGKSKIEVRMTPWWGHTGTVITFDAARPLAFKHTRFVNDRINRARKVFNSVNDRWDEFSKGVKRMLSYPITEKEAKDFIESVLPHSGDEPSTRLENIRSEIFTIYRDTGIGTRLPTCRNTLFGVVQAFTEWADIKRTVRTSTKRDDISAALDSKLVSDSAKKKQIAWATALYLAKNKKMSGALK